MTTSEGCCVYAQATQWGQIVGIAAHSLAALSPAALSPAALSLAAFRFAACRVCHAHTVILIGMMHGSLRWTSHSAPNPPSVAYHIHSFPWLLHCPMFQTLQNLSIYASLAATDHLQHR